MKPAAWIGKRVKGNRGGEKTLTNAAILSPSNNLNSPPVEQIIAWVHCTAVDYNSLASYKTCRDLNSCKNTQFCLHLHQMKHTSPPLRKTFPQEPFVHSWHSQLHTKIKHDYNNKLTPKQQQQQLSSFDTPPLTAWFSCPNEPSFKTCTSMTFSPPPLTAAKHSISFRTLSAPTPLAPSSFKVVFRDGGRG